MVECSAKAKNSLLLYRGADLDKDSLIVQDNIEEAYNLSFGSGIFAGALYDSGKTGATPLQYMKKNNGHVLLIPFKEEKKTIETLFIIPEDYSNTIGQLNGTGEHFHPRSKFGHDKKEVKGMGVPDPLPCNKFEPYKSTLTNQELEKLYQRIKNEYAVSLIYNNKPV